jgi:hypothetical protein
MYEDRKKVWIDHVQTKLFCRIVVYWLIYQLSLINLVFVWRLVKEGAGNPFEQYGRLLVDFMPMLIGCVVLLPFLAWDAVKFGHRVMGPIFRFRKTLQALADGEAVRPVRLREGDLLTETRDDFNRMLETLQRQGYPALLPNDSEVSEPPARSA